MSAVTYLAELTTVYEKELAQYAAFLRSAQQLTETLKSNESGTRLTELFAEQSEIIANINNLDQSARELKTRLAAELAVDEVSVSAVSSLPGSVEFEAVLQNLATLLQKLQAVEQENTALLEKRLKTIMHKPEVAAPKQSVRLAYRKAPEPGDSSFDKKR